MEKPRGPQSGSWEYKKRTFFQEIALPYRDSLAMHKLAGLWERTQEGKRDWRNVSEHCLMELARVRVLADMLGLSEPTNSKLQQAAILHDYFKKQERLMAKAAGGTREAYEQASDLSDQMLRVNGFNEEVIRLSGSVGSNQDVLDETERILDKPVLSEEDTAYLAMHYVDDFTVESNWAIPVEVNVQGDRINDLDRRMDKNDARYPELKMQGAFEAQRKVGYAVENRLAVLISERLGEQIDPELLPEVIDNNIQALIQNK